MLRNGPKIAIIFLEVFYVTDLDASRNEPENHPLISWWSHDGFLCVA
jgi:hypothetical protein